MVELGACRKGGGFVVSVAFALAIGGCGTDGSGPAGSGQMGGTTGGTAAAPRPDPAFAIFDNTRLHEIAITMAPEDWQSILDDSRGDEDRHATFSYDGTVVEDVGVHPSGETSRFAGNPKMSVRIKFDAFPDRGKFGGVSEIKLKGQWDDPSMMRDGLSKFVYRAAAPTGQEAYAHLTVNGDDRGLYAVVEVWDKDALLAHHFREPVGPLYRIRGFAPPADPYAFMGSDPAAYMPLPWEPHINHPAEGDQVIVDLTTTLANNPAQVETVVDMDTLLGFLAASTLVQNIDGMVGSDGVQDHYQYFDTATKKFFPLIWDPDKTLSCHGEAPDRSITINFEKNALTATILSSPDLLSRYHAKLAAVAAAVPATAVQAEADRIYQQIQTVAYADPVKRYDNGTFDWNLGLIKDFVAQRYANVADQLASSP